jgi:hypothetical protein
MSTIRRFVYIARFFDPDARTHVLDAIADDGTAWWRVIGDEEEFSDSGWCLMEPLPTDDHPQAPRQ